MKTSNYGSRYLPWLLTTVVSVLAVYVWGSSSSWNLGQIDAYQFFPVLGLLGFSIMWSHYVVGAFTPGYLSEQTVRPYFRYTSYAVLLAIVLHPGILIYARFRDGYGLPPGSYETYVAPGRAWIAMLGSISLLLFLAYELHRWYGQKSWWTYVLMAGDAAMVAIFYHALRLGGLLQGGWYRGVWYGYGIVLAVILGYKYGRLVRTKLKPARQDIAR